MLLAGLLITFIAILILQGAIAVKFQEMDLRWLSFAGPISGLAFIILSNRLYQQRISKVRTSPDLVLKINEFRQATVLRMILLDVASVTNLLFYAVTDNLLFALLSGAVFLVFFLYFPNLERLIRDMQLNPDEERIVREGK